MPFIAAPLATPRPTAFHTSFFGSRRPVCSRPIPIRRAFIHMQAPSSQSSSKTPYKVGFCLAGAATGGAYSAGVMDFLLEALAEWDRLKNEPNPDPSIPQWDVAITEIIGTSAGGINSTLTVHALNTDHKPLPRDYNLSSGPADNNSLFNLWVYEATYNKVLQTADLDRQEPFNKTVASFFYADFMTDTVSKVLTPPVIRNALPPWATNLHLSLTATNLRGVPYSVDNFTDRTAAGSKYHMRKYADYTQFRVTLDPSTLSAKEKGQVRVINLSSERTDPTWQPAITCSRATAAFPVGFPTVRIHTPRPEYERRMPLPPDWAEDDDTVEEERDIYEYAAVDGGVCNNEPFGILIDNMERRNDHKKLEALSRDSWGSVILVDPFPSTQSDPRHVEEGLPVVKTIQTLFSATRGEASFKEDEITAALSDKSMEKFMIAPKAVADPSETKQLATSGLGTFAGILDPSIPYHDFVLGRLNCQYFLQNVFVMKREDAEQNDIFKDHLEYVVGDRISIIPVVGSAKEPIAKPQWPTFGEQGKEAIIKDVMASIDERMKKVLRAYMENLGIIKDYGTLGIIGKVGQFGTRRAAELIESRLRDKLNSMAEDEVRSAMKIYD